jgi:hypothetical protein
MKSRITAFLQVIFKILWSLSSIVILAHLAFIIMVLLKLNIPECAGVKNVNYPVKVFWTDADLHNGRRSQNGNIIPFQKSPFDFNLQNIKDPSNIIHVTTVTGNLTVDINNESDILFLIFLKRISFVIIFFFIAFQFDKLFSSFQNNEPFNPKNVSRLKTVAFLVLGLSPAGLLFNEITIHIFNSYKIAANNTTVSHNLNPQYIVLGLLILVIAYAFDTGTQLQKESELTI